MIHVEGLVKEFKHRKRRVVAVEHIDFDIPAGQFVGYAGPNGAGKSTTVKMMCGLTVPSAGTVTVDGLIPWRQRKVLAQRMGVVFGQRSQLWWDLPLRRSFEIVGALYGVPSVQLAQRLDELDGYLELTPLLTQPVRSLSLGQRMRAELAAAVLPRPKVLFLDEPTIGLDVEAKVAVREFLAAMNREHGTTVVLTTHDLDDITRLCERLLIIDHGRLIYDGTVDALKASYATERVLMVDLADDATIEIESLVGDVSVQRRQDRRWWLSFDPTTTPAPQLVAKTMEKYQVVDLALEEPDIEDIIRRIYRGEHAPAQA